MRCKCGGLMIPRRLTIDTVANVCTSCGRDDIERKPPPVDDNGYKPKIQPVTKKKTLSQIKRQCPVCLRKNLKFTTKRCQRCCDRERKGKDIFTGKPIVTLP